MTATADSRRHACVAVAIPVVLSAVLGSLAGGNLLAVVVPITVGRVSVSAAVVLMSACGLTGAALGLIVTTNATTRRPEG